MPVRSKPPNLAVLKNGSHGLARREIPFEVNGFGSLTMAQHHSHSFVVARYLTEFQQLAAAPALVAGQLVI